MSTALFDNSAVDTARKNWASALSHVYVKSVGSAPRNPECKNTGTQGDDSEPDAQSPDSSAAAAAAAGEELETYSDPQDLPEPKTVGNRKGNVWLEVCTQNQVGKAYCVSQGTIEESSTFIDQPNLVTQSRNVITLVLPVSNDEWLDVVEDIIGFMHTKELTIDPAHFCIYFLLFSYLGIKAPNSNGDPKAEDVFLAETIQKAIEENAEFDPDNAIKRLSEIFKLNNDLRYQLEYGKTLEGGIAQRLFTRQRMEFERVVDALLDYPPRFLEFTQFSSPSRELHARLRYIRSPKHQDLDPDEKIRILDHVNKSALSYYDLLDLQSTGLYDDTVMAPLFSNLLDVLYSRHIPVTFCSRRSSKSNLVLDSRLFQPCACGGAAFVPKTQEVFMTGNSEVVVVQSFGAGPRNRRFSTPFPLFNHPPVYDEKDHVYFFERKEAREGRQESHVSRCNVRTREQNEIITTNTITFAETFAGCAVGNYVCAVNSNGVLCLLDTTKDEWIATVELGQHVHMLHGTGNCIYALDSHLRVIEVTEEGVRQVWDEELPRSFGTSSGVREAVVWKEPGTDVVLAVDNGGRWFSIRVPTEARERGLKKGDILVKPEEGWTPVRSRSCVSSYAFLRGNTLHYISGSEWFCVDMAPSCVHSARDGDQMVRPVPEVPPPQSKSFLGRLFSFLP